MSKPIVISNLEDIKNRYHYVNGEIFDSKRQKFLHKANTIYGYFRVPVLGKYYYMHRLVYAICNNNPVFGFLDHKNGNRKDNRIENLREASANENTWNKKISSNNVIGVKGIRKRGKRFEARIMHSGKSLYSAHKSLDSAVSWLNEKRESLHKAFANNGIHKEI